MMARSPDRWWEIGFLAFQERFQEEVRGYGIDSCDLSILLHHVNTLRIKDYDVISK